MRSRDCADFWMSGICRKRISRLSTSEYSKKRMIQGYGPESSTKRIQERFFMRICPKHQRNNRFWKISDPVWWYQKSWSTEASSAYFGIHEDYIDHVVKEEIREVIHQQEFSNDSYMWVNEVLRYEGGENYAIRRIHPNLKDTEGNFLSTDTQDAAGNLPYLMELEGIRSSGEVFFTYHFKKLNSDIISEKITYAKLYEPYDWIVAMGVHLDDVKSIVESVTAVSDASLSDNILMFLIYSILAIAMGFLVLYVVNERYFRKSMEKLESELNLDLLTGAGSRRCWKRR